MGYQIVVDGKDVGRVTDFYFDDAQWRIRYMVVDTGNWLSGRRVLIAPKAMGEPDWAKEVIPVALTKEEIENSPPVSTDRPVSRQNETELSIYYGWPAYWGWGPMGQVPLQPAPPMKTPSKEAPETDEPADGEGTRRLLHGEEHS